MRKGWYFIGLVVLYCSMTVYADNVDYSADIAQSNSNADRIAAQAQANMTRQQQILTQRLQALAAAMQAQNPDTPIVVQPVPTPVQQAPVTPAPAPAATATPTTPPVATTPNATGFTSSSQNNNDSRNQWNYGF